MSSESETDTVSQRDPLLSATKAQLMNRAHILVTSITKIATGDSSKLNKTDIRDITTWGQELLAVVTHLDLRLAEAEIQVTKCKLEASKAASRALTLGATEDTAAQETGFAPRAMRGAMSYAGALKVARGAPPKPLPSARGPVLAVYPGSEDTARTAEETKNYLRPALIRLNSMYKSTN
ncbi:hypothetical protein EVAR_65184_1 [Eumeta japonica]|uniref:Uncharacterized protein n=1 Tax=Eumeta variegata TaxID=151549 RepID=A0A4C1ZK63_EUMVA|nr:hypothetical protein EVAR_65184_1 [Eumeta japonica]